MNVQHYFAIVSDGMFALMGRVGLGAQEIRRRQMSFAVVRAEADFHRELHAGMSSRSSRRSQARREVGHLSPSTETRATGTIAMSTEFKCVLLDLEKREATTIPDDIRNAAAKLFSLEA